MMFKPYQFQRFEKLLKMVFLFAAYYVQRGSIGRVFFSFSIG
jgi:hypothetical protein